MKRFAQVLAVFLLVAPLPAGAEDITIFGLKLGSELVLPECPYKMDGERKSYKFREVVSVCAESPAPIRTYGQPVRRIAFPLTSAPAILKNWSLIALEIDGRLEGIEFFTSGISSQELVFEQLTEKFGKPTALNRRAMQTMMGAAFEVIDATWDSPALYVRFRGAESNVNSGNVTIDRPAATAARHKWLRNIIDSRTTL